MARHISDFQTIHSEGGLLPPDLLRRILDPNEKIPGTLPEDYGLPHGERINETITQSWNRLRRHWAEFREAAAHLPGGDAGTGLTNDKWNLPILRELGFGMLPTSPGPEVGGRTYAINRFSGPAAIHMIGCGLSLDRRAAGVRGAALVNPHGLVQEFLNRSEGHLWAIVSNGLRLRVLRDNQALSRQSYLEFDLEAMFSGEVFSDFVLLWLTAHATRFAAREEGKPESCWLEEWTKLANEQGARALESLRGGVESALQALGQGFVSHPRNTALRESLRSGSQTLSDFHGQLLRVVYRLIFLFVTEDRSLEGISLLHPPDDSEEGRLARERYAAHYSTTRLRELASRIKGTRHGDLWQQFNLLVGALSGGERFEVARTQLALPTLGSFLWSPESTAAINAASLTGTDGAELTNADFLDALRNLAFIRQNRVLRPVDYKNLGAEELGGVYESLLALTPQISGDGARFTFAEFAGNERKTSGSYYTPDSLVQCLLDSALDPVVDEAIKAKTGSEAEQAILNLKVCDPACGSGHFLVGAAHRLARHLARVRALAQGDSEPSPTLYQAALRDVIGHCLYGVDINPMAAELCRVSLWLEAIEPGKPLTFLDHHIQVGNSLLGTTPALLKRGIPDDAFKPIEGDDKEFCKKYKKRNKEEREATFGERDDQAEWLDLADQPWQHLGNLGTAMLDLERLKDDTVEALHAKEEAYARHVQSSGYLFNKFLHDAWCAAFIWVKTKTDERPYPITQKMLGRIERNPHDCPPWMHGEIVQLAELYQFFHWHLAFPDVFTPKSAEETEAEEVTGWAGGFDVILGNPPWERVNLEAKQFFATNSPEIAEATTTKRRKLLQSLASEAPGLFSAFQDAQRRANSEILFFQKSGLYPHINQARLNTYLLFTEVSIRLPNRRGRIGIIVPSGVATDDVSKKLFSYLIADGRIVRLVDFENRHGVFAGVHRSYKFCLLTLRGSSASEPARLTFFLHKTEELQDRDRTFFLTAKEFEAVSPITGLCPTFRSKYDKELVLAIYRRVKPLITQQEQNVDWKQSDFLIMFRSDDSAHLYRTVTEIGLCDPPPASRPLLRADDKLLVPVWESKLIQQFDHRFATFAGTDDSERVKGRCKVLSSSEKPDAWFAIPRYWVSLEAVAECLLPRAWTREWMLGYRDITNATNERTAIASCLPQGGAAQPLNLFLPKTSLHALQWLASMNSFVLDYVARQRIGGIHLNITTCRQLPVLGPASMLPKMVQFVSKRVLELVFTSTALDAFAADCGCSSPPFHWDEERRFLLRCELDAAIFHQYLPAENNGAWSVANDETEEDLARLMTTFATPREAVTYIMDTFPIVIRRDEQEYGEYRTKRVILEIYDAMQQALATGRSYQTVLDPPPGPPVDAEGNFVSMYQWDRDNWPPHIHSPHPEWDESLLTAWFDVCQKRWCHLDDDQVFPWDGREAFIYALIPYLVKERPGEKFEFYRDAALLASRPERCEALLLNDTQRTEYRQTMDKVDWLQFPDTHRIRPKAIRKKLQNNQLIVTDANTGTTTLVDEHCLPTLPMPLHPLLPLILQAADTLDRLQRRALEDAEAAKVTFTYDDISKEFTAMSVA